MIDKPKVKVKDFDEMVRVINGDSADDNLFVVWLRTEVEVVPDDYEGRTYALWDDEDD